MANLSNKYLDLAGLEIFWNKANAYIKRHISDEINKIDGTNVLLDNNDDDSHSISYEISELWKVIGGGTPGEGSGNISQDISTILGAYVKSIEGDDGDYISIGPSNKTTGPVDVKLEIDETKLKQKLDSLEGRSGVSSVKATGVNGITVTGAESASIGAIEISVDGQDLKDYADEQASEAETNAKTHIDNIVGSYKDGETPASGIRGEIEAFDNKLSGLINSEISNRKLKDSLLAGDDWDNDGANWKADSTPTYPNITSLSAAVDEHKGKIDLLVSATQFKGVDNTVDVNTDVDYNVYRVGDIILNGAKEYIADIKTEDGGSGKWILLGDVTAESGAITSIITWINTTRIQTSQIQALFGIEPETPEE